MFGFTVMHAVFILFTQMEPSQGGLGFSEAQNGRIFALIGILGIVTQGGLIGPLTRKYGSLFILRFGSVLSGIGLVLIPYSSLDFVWAWMILITGCIAIGNGLFQPSSSTVLTSLAREEDYEFARVSFIFRTYSRTINWRICVDHHSRSKRLFRLSYSLPHLRFIDDARIPPLIQG